MDTNTTNEETSVPVAFQDYEEPVSQKQAAELTGLSTAVLTRLRTDGTGPRYFSIPGGGKRKTILYRPSILRDWIESLQVIPEPAEETTADEPETATIEDLFTEE